jgi:D-3-phosphoglycerate dehydrogenase
VPGILAQINSVLVKNNLNLLGQYLKTTEDVGYVILDVDQNHSKEVEKELANIEGTIKFRVLY